ncbi:MAG: glycosyltransferase family 39 protein [Candidatus Roizmanbacteria bacterium]|nr:glycosyltransferase family 39 protein [Candidatus Roizmanbacteria bacterium]
MKQYLILLISKYRIQLLFFSAFFIRLIGLNQSVWLDEATTARVVKEYTLVELVRQFAPFDFHPPLYYLFMKTWTTIAGYSEIALRLPSVVFSLVAGYFIYKTALYVVDKKKAPLASALFLFNPLIVYYSQEARMYMFAVCLLSMATYYFFADERMPQLKTKIYLGLLLSASFAVFYGSIFYMSGILLLLLLRRRYRALFVVSLCTVIMVLLLSPLTISQFIHSRTALSSVSTWSSVLGTVTIKNILLIPLKFIVGRISFEPKWFYWLLSGIWGVIVWFMVVKGFVVQKKLLVLSTIPLLLGILFSFFSPLLSYFRFIYLLIPISISLASGISGKKSAYGIVLGFIFFSGLYVCFPRFHREDWKSAAQAIPAHTVVYGVPSSMDALTYYRPDIQVKDIRTLQKRTAPKTFIVFPYTTDIYGINTMKEFAVTQYQDYRGVIVMYISH